MNNSSMNSNIQDTSTLIFPESNPAHLFCETKAEINIPNEYGWTPLYRSLVSNNIVAMKELLKFGADPNITNNMGETPLYQSVDNENYEAMLILLENEADCNICKSDGMSPLHLAVKKNLKKFIEKLLEHKANPNLKNKLYQQTPLHIAVKNKNEIDIIKMLLKYGADTTIKDKYDSVPYDYCEDEGYKTEINKIAISETKSNTNNIVEENVTGNMISAIHSTPNKSEDIISKFSSSEIAKESNFNSSTPNTFLVNNNSLSNNLQSHINNIGNSSSIKENPEIHTKYSSKTEIEHVKLNNNNSLVSSDNQILKNCTFNNIIKTTPLYTNKPANKKPQTSTFNLSTPKENSCSSRKTNSINSNSYKENNIFTLENGLGSFLTINSKKQNTSSNNNSSGNKDMISEINPLDLINQVVTTTNNSNIFSELQNNTQEQHSMNKTKSDELVCDIKTPEKDTKKKNDENINNANNEDIKNLNDSLEDHDMTYSKSKSYIVSELPMTSVKKLSPSKVNNSMVGNENEKEQEFTNHKVNHFNIIQKPTNITKISYHQNRSTATNTASLNANMGANKENNLNIINLPYNAQQDTSKCSSSDYFYIEDNEKTASNTPMILNNKYLNSSSGANNNITELDINNSNMNSNRDYNPYNKNSTHAYSINSTRPTLYNINSNRVLNNSNSGGIKKQTLISQLAMSSAYDASTNSSNTNNNFNTYTLGGNNNLIINNNIPQKQKKNSILTDYAFKGGQWVPRIYLDENSPTHNTKTPQFVGIKDNGVDFRTKISANEAKRLHEWLLSADLLCYYNTLLDQGIYEIDKCIDGVANGDLSLSFKDIEDLGIRKPGHIYRFLLKLQCDANIIDQRVTNYIIPNKMTGDGILRDSNVNFSLGTSQNCCGCAMVERKTVKELDIESWLRLKGLLHLRENFLHNGFDTFEYVMIQTFSCFSFDDNILTDCLHVYSASDRKKLKNALCEEKKRICEKIGMKYLAMEMEENNKDNVERCQMCTIF